VIGLSAAAQFGSYGMTYWINQRGTPPGPPELAVILREVTQPKDVVLVFGQDWNPQLAYYSGRRAIMVTDRLTDRPELLASVLDRLVPGERVTAMVATGELRHYPKFFAPLVRRLGLQPAPLLADSNTHVYLEQLPGPELYSHVEQLGLKSFAFVDDTTAEQTQQRHQYAASELSDQRLWLIVDRSLAELIHPYGFGIHDQKGFVAVDAHAPTEMVFNVTGEKQEVMVEFGIIAGAWQNEQPTDGVEFRLDLIPTGGRPQMLFRRELRPVEEPADRAIQHVTVPLPAGVAGRLRLRTLPGPAGSFASDWAFWSKVAFH
jgi:hypothetical protein